MEQEYPLQSRILREIIQEYRQAQEKSKKQLKEACDFLRLPQEYRSYANVCSLYQYLYIEKDATFSQACDYLNAEILMGYYVYDPVQATEQLEQVRIYQPIWVEKLTEQNRQVESGLCNVKNNTVRIVHEKLYKLSGSELEYEYTKFMSGWGIKYGNGGLGKSINETECNVDRAYRRIVGQRFN